MARDIFDLAVAYSNRQKDILDIFSKFSDKTRNFYTTFHNLTLDGNTQYSLAQTNSILPDGVKYVGKEGAICVSLEKQLLQRLFDKFKLSMMPAYNATTHTFIDYYNRSLRENGDPEAAVIEASKMVIKIYKCDSAKVMSIMHELLPQAKEDDTYSIKIIKKAKTDPDIARLLSTRNISKEFDIFL